MAAYSAAITIPIPSDWDVVVPQKNTPVPK